MRSMPTTCARSSACSSAIRWCRRRSSASPRRRAKAGQLQEEVRVPGARRRRPRAGCVFACGRCSRAATYARWTAWSITDVTRDRDRQENVFQELQHAIDFLDHAPAGFFSVDPDGNVSYLNATLAGWLDHDLAQVGSGGLKLADIVVGDGAALLAPVAGRAGRREDRDARPRPQDARQAGPSRSVFTTRSRSRPTARRAPRARWCSTARARTWPIRRAPPKCASCASSTTPRWRSRRSTRRARSRAPMRRSSGCSTASPRATRSRPRAARSSPSSPSRIAPRSRPRSRRAANGQGDIAPVDGVLAGEAQPLGALLRLGGRRGRAGRRGRDRLHDRDHGSARAREAGRAGAEDGHGRPARRRHRARLQQRALRHHDGDRLPAQRAQADRSLVRRHHADQAERQPRREPGAAPARVLAPPDACGRRCSISARRCPISACC